MRVAGLSTAIAGGKLGRMLSTTGGMPSQVLSIEEGCRKMNAAVTGDLPSRVLLPLKGSRAEMPCRVLLLLEECRAEHCCFWSSLCEAIVVWGNIQ